MTTTIVATVGRWASAAACAGTRTDNVAAEVCTGCPVRVECLTHALETRVTHGTWAGYDTAGIHQLLVTHHGDIGEAVLADHRRHEITRARRHAANAAHPAVGNPNQPTLFEATP
ncbi:MAG: WhiB family transcriptional regulator [Acidimicrobiales bacterium]